MNVPYQIRYTTKNLYKLNLPTSGPLMKNPKHKYSILCLTQTLIYCEIKALRSNESYPKVILCLIRKIYSFRSGWRHLRQILLITYLKGRLDC